MGLVLSTLLVAFEALGVATAMPVVVRNLGGLDLYGWVFSGFMLGSLVGIVVAGQMSDRGGLLRPYAIGLGFFGGGLLCGGLAPAMWFLVLARVFQGFGAGFIPIVTYAAIGRGIEDRRRPRLFAILSTAWVVPGLVGPAIAGAVAEHLTWRLVFLGLLPIVLAAAAITGPRLWRLDRSRDGTASQPRAGSPGLSWRGRVLPALATSAGAGILLVGLTSTTLAGLALVPVGLALGVPAIVRLVPPGTLRARPGLPTTILLRGMVTFGFFGAEAFLPLTLVAVRHQSATLAGLALTGATLTWAVASWLQSHYVGRLGARRLIATGFATMAIGIAAVALVLQPSVPVGVAVIAWSIGGLGAGLSYPVISLQVIRQAPAGQTGSAASAMQLVDVLGTALGAGIGGAVVAATTIAGQPSTSALAAIFGGAVCVEVAGSVLTRRLEGTAPQAGLALATAPLGHETPALAGSPATAGQPADRAPGRRFDDD